MIKEVRVAYMSQQGMIVLKESLGPVVRGIAFDYPCFIVEKFNAVDGKTKKTYLNTRSSVWYEFDVAEDTDVN